MNIYISHATPWPGLAGREPAPLECAPVSAIMVANPTIQRAYRIAPSISVAPTRRKNAVLGLIAVRTPVSAGVLRSGGGDVSACGPGEDCGLRSSGRLCSAGPGAVLS